MELSDYTDKQLRDELARRVAERKAAKDIVPRCKNCKFCGSGHCQRNPKPTTTVCYAKPKPQCGDNRYYATSPNNKACELYDKR